ncbi:MAG: sulfatase activating formylglycine-generating enzyme [Polaribacter sp.]|jgi:formylglycine-generating enzyme required for sulfatase activity
METKLHKIITLLLVCFLHASILIAQTLPEGIVMKDIDGGTFIMGSNSLKGSTEQREAAPEHQVTISDYAMSEAEINNKQYVEFLNAAFSEGLIQIVTGIAGPDKDKLIIQGTAASAYEGKTLYSLDGIRVLKDHGNEDDENNEFTGSVEPENPLNMAYIGFKDVSNTFYVKDPFNVDDFNWKEICNYQDYGAPMIFEGAILNDFDDWAGSGLNYSDELQGWTENNPENSTSLPTQTEVSAWPVTFIRWWGAKAFAAYYNLSIPTEAQWEYAAKAGSNFEYAVFDGSTVSDANWNQAGIDVLATGHVRSAISGSANPFGLYNLAGNVWEWIADNYVAPYDTSAVTDPFIEVSGSTERSWRGGSWNYHENTLQSAMRFSDSEDKGNDHFGFRIVGAHSTLSSEKFIKTGFNMYPNPATDHLTISRLNSGKPSDVYIYAINGQLVVRYKVNSDIQTINVSSLSKGIYILNIDEIIKKLVIE